MRIVEVRMPVEHCMPCYVEVVADNGLVGIGSAGAYAFHIAPIIFRGHPSLSEIITGSNPLEPRAIWNKMYINWQAQWGRGSEGGLAVNAMAALDMAIWDPAGKALDLPLHRMLGGALCDRIPVYASSTIFDYEAWEKNRSLVLRKPECLAADAKRLVDIGFTAIKYGWGNNFSVESEKCLAFVRETIGPEIKLMLDFGCPAYWDAGWNLKQAIQAAKMMERYNCFFFEEPFPPHEVNSFKELKKSTQINIATGESLTSVNDFKRLIDANAVDIIQPDAAQIGITQFDETIRMAEHSGILCIPHGPWSVFTITSHLHLLSNHRNISLIEYPDITIFELNAKTGKITKLATSDIVEHPFEFDNGYLKLNERPGLGLGNFKYDALKELDNIAIG